MAILLIILAMGGVLVFTVGGVFSPAAIVIAVAVVIGYFVLRRAMQKRGSAAKL
jgi:hypothetical protein